MARGSRSQAVDARSMNVRVVAACEVADELCIDAALIKVMKMHQSMNCDIISTPALVTNEQVRACG